MNLVSKRAKCNSWLEENAIFTLYNLSYRRGNIRVFRFNFFSDFKSLGLQNILKSTKKCPLTAGFPQKVPLFAIILSRNASIRATILLLVAGNSLFVFTYVPFSERNLEKKFHRVIGSLKQFRVKFSHQYSKHHLAFLKKYLKNLFITFWKYHFNFNRQKTDFGYWTVIIVNFIIL